MGGESHWKENQKNAMANVVHNPVRVLKTIFRIKRKNPCLSPSVKGGCLDEVQHLV